MQDSTPANVNESEPSNFAASRDGSFVGNNNIMISES